MTLPSQKNVPVTLLVLSNSLHMDVKCRQQAIFCYFCKTFLYFKFLLLWIQFEKCIQMSTNKSGSDPLVLEITQEFVHCFQYPCSLYLSWPLFRLSFVYPCILVPSVLSSTSYDDCNVNNSVSHHTSSFSCFLKLMMPPLLVLQSSRPLIFPHSLCHQLHQQIIHQASSSIMEVTLLECFINIMSCTHKFLDLSHTLYQTVGAQDVHICWIFFFLIHPKCPCWSVGTVLFAFWLP